MRCPMITTRLGYSQTGLPPNSIQPSRWAVQGVVKLSTYELWQHDFLTEMISLVDHANDP